MAGDPAPLVRRPRLDEWRRWLGRQAHVFRREPSLVFQQAANEPENSPPARAAVARASEARIAERAWVRRLAKGELSQARLLTLVVGRSGVTACAIHPLGTSLAAGGEDDSVRIWSAHTGAPQAALAVEPAARIQQLAFSPDGALVAAVDGESAITLWRVATQAVVARMPSQGELVRLCGFSPQRDRLLLARRTGGSARFRIESTALDASLVRNALGELEAELVATAIDSSRGRLATLDAAGEVQLWDLATERAVASISLRCAALALAFTAEGSRLLLLERSGRVLEWSPTEGGLVEIARIESLAQHGVVGAIAPGGRSVALSQHDGGFRLWRPGRGERDLVVLEGHSPAAPLGACAFSADGALFVSTSADGLLLLWDATAEAPTVEQVAAREHFGEWDRTREGHFLPVVDCAVSADGRWLLSADVAGRALLWEGDHVHHELGFVAEERFGLRRCGLGPHRQVLVCTSERLLYAPDGRYRELAAEPREGHGFFACALAADASLAAATRADGRLDIWELSAERRVATVDLDNGPLRCCVFSQRGRWIAAGGTGAAYLVDLRRSTSETIALDATCEVLDCAFSPDRRWLALGLADGRVLLHPLRPLLDRIVLRVPGSGGIDRCAFAPTGELLATRSRDGWLRIWNYEQRRCLACAPVTTIELPWIEQALVGLAWRPGGRELFCPGTDGGLASYRIEAGGAASYPSTATS